MTFGAVFPRVARPAFGPGLASAGAAGNWWEAGGATGCVAAYQPKGAASLAASYVNLANPGTYNAAPGTAPTFDTATGWAFDGLTQYLNTGVSPVSGFSMIVKFTNFSSSGNQLIVGYVFEATTRFGAGGTASVNWMNYGDNQGGPGSRITTGTLAITPAAYYVNSTEYTHAGTFTGTGAAITIGKGGGYFASVKVQAVAIYNTTLTAPQVAAISAAMSAL